MKYRPTKVTLNCDDPVLNNLTLIIAASVVMFSVIFCAGCEQVEQRSFKGGEPLSYAQISKEDIQDKLNNFEEYFTSSIKQSASELDKLSTETRLHKLSLLWRIRSVAALHNMMQQDDPLIAFIDTWTLCVRMTEYFETGQGHELFAPHQDIAISVSKQIEGDVEAIAKTFLSEKIFNETRTNVYNFAWANPIQGTFLKTTIYATEVRKDPSNPFYNVITLPVAPFRAMEGVDRGSTAIYKFSNTAERFAEIVEELPDSTRWQLMLLLYEIEEANTTKSFLTNMEGISKSGTRLADTAEKLPQQIREELSIAIEEIDNKQANIQKTLDKAESTAAVIEGLLAKMNQTAEVFTVTSQNVNEAAKAWQSAADATRLTINQMNRKESAKDTASSSSIKDLRDTADAITKTANELRLLNAELNENVDRISSKAHAFTGNLTWKIAVLLVLILLLALTYRCIGIYVSTRWGRKNQAKLNDVH